MARHISEGRGKRKRGALRALPSAESVVILSHPPINAKARGSTGLGGANSDCLHRGNRVWRFFASVWPLQL